MSADQSQSVKPDKVKVKLERTPPCLRSMFGTDILCEARKPIVFALLGLQLSSTRTQTTHRIKAFIYLSRNSNVAIKQKSSAVSI